MFSITGVCKHDTKVFWTDVMGLSFWNVSPTGGLKCKHYRKHSNTGSLDFHTLPERQQHWFGDRSASGCVSIRDAITMFSRFTYLQMFSMFSFYSTFYSHCWMIWNPTKRNTIYPFTVSDFSTHPPGLWSLDEQSNETYEHRDHVDLQKTSQIQHSKAFVQMDHRLRSVLVCVIVLVSAIHTSQHLKWINPFIKVVLNLK